MTGFDWFIVVWLVVLTAWIVRFRVFQMSLAGSVMALAEFLKEAMTGEKNDVR